MKNLVSIFKLVRHSDGIYRCKNGFIDVLFFVTFFILLVLWCVTYIFAIPNKIVSRLIGFPR